MRAGAKSGSITRRNGAWSTPSYSSGIERGRSGGRGIEFAVQAPAPARVGTDTLARRLVGALEHLDAHDLGARARHA